MKALVTFAILVGLASPALADDYLDQITVKVEPNLSRWNNAGDGYYVGVSIQNSTPKALTGINYECLGYADGVLVSRGIGTVLDVGPNRLVYDEASLHNFAKLTDITCRPTLVVPAPQ